MNNNIWRLQFIQSNLGTHVATQDELRRVRATSKKNLAEALSNNRPETIQKLFGQHQTPSTEQLIFLANIINMATIVGRNHLSGNKYTNKLELPDWDKLSRKVISIGVPKDTAYDIINICIHEGSMEKKSILGSNYRTNSAQTLYNNINRQININNKQGNIDSKPIQVISHKDIKEYFETSSNADRARAAVTHLIQIIGRVRIEFSPTDLASHADTNQKNNEPALFKSDQEILVKNSHNEQLHQPIKLQQDLDKELNSGVTDNNVKDGNNSSKELESYVSANHNSADFARTLPKDSYLSQLFQKEKTNILLNQSEYPGDFVDAIVYSPAENKIFRMPNECEGRSKKITIRTALFRLSAKFQRDMTATQNEKYIPSNLIKKVHLAPFPIKIADNSTGPILGDIGYFSNGTAIPYAKENGNRIFRLTIATRPLHFIPQDYLESCCFACINMIALEKGISQQDLLEQNDNRQTDEGISRHFNTILPNYTLEIIKVKQATELNNLITTDAPIMCSIGGHVIIIDNINKETVRVRDPFHGIICDVDLSFLDKIDSAYCLTKK